MRYWLDDQLAGIFDVKVRPSAETADQIYDQIAAVWTRRSSSRGHCMRSSRSR